MSVAALPQPWRTPSAPRRYLSPFRAAYSFLHRSWSIEAIALMLYVLRDATAGPLRYYLAILRLDVFWFIPDVAAMVCIVSFAYRYAYLRRNVAAAIFLFYVAFALILGYVFLGTFAAMASSFKMFAPVFVGLCFCERYLHEYKLVLTWMTALLYVSITGVILSSYFRFPWIGFAFESFGATREAGRLWWSERLEERLSGFAADSTMAAFFILVTFMFASIRRSLLWVLVMGAVSLYVVRMTTNKTSLGVLAIYIVTLLIVRSVSEANRFRVLRFFALWSFLVILIPPVLIIVFAGVDLARLNPTLFSMQDRINFSWQLPFIYLEHLMPLGYFTGCGLGCFNYPQQLFSPHLKSYFVPVDNFYIGTYLMFGMPFVVFMLAVILSMRQTRDIYRLTIIYVMNIFTITILSYGPASGLLLIGIAFSEVFVSRGAPVAPSRDMSRRGPRPRPPPPVRPNGSDGDPSQMADRFGRDRRAGSEPLSPFAAGPAS